MITKLLELKEIKLIYLNDLKDIYESEHFVYEDVKNSKFRPCERKFENAVVVGKKKC